MINFGDFTEENKQNLSKKKKKKKKKWITLSNIPLTRN